MNLSTPVDEGYKELLDEIEPLIEETLANLEERYDGDYERPRLSADERRGIKARIDMLDKWLRNLEMIRARELQEQARRCALTQSE